MPPKGKNNKVGKTGTSSSTNKRQNSAPTPGPKAIAAVLHKKETQCHGIEEILNIWNDVLSKNDSIPNDERMCEIITSLKSSEIVKKLFKTHNTSLTKVLKEKTQVEFKLTGIRDILAAASDTNWDIDSIETLKTVEEKIQKLLESKQEIDDDIDKILQKLQGRSRQSVNTAITSSPITKPGTENDEAEIYPKRKIDQIGYEIDKMIEENETYERLNIQITSDLNSADINIASLIPPCQSCNDLKQKITSLEKNQPHLAEPNKTSHTETDRQVCETRKSIRNNVELGHSAKTNHTKSEDKDCQTDSKEIKNQWSQTNQDKCLQCSTLKAKNVELQNDILSKNKIISILIEDTQKDQAEKRSKKVEADVPPLKKSKSYNELQSSTIKELKLKVQDLSLRLSDEMSKKISNDESSVENISIKDRPMNVADEYSALCGNLWMDAKVQLDAYDWNTGDTDEGKTKNMEFLESILTTSALKASELYDNVWKILAEPISFSQVAMTGGQQNVPQQLRVQVGDYFRISADRINYDYLVQTIKVSIQEKHGIKSEKSIEELWKDKVSVYVTNCAQLGWKMAIQRPPMEFRKPGLDEVWNRKGEIEPAWGSRPDKKNAKVRYYQHPVMYHGDKVMIRGMAMIS